MSDDWKYIIWSDESSFTLFPTSGRVYVWRTPKAAHNPECLVPAVRHGGESMMIWAAISWYSPGPKTISNGRITASRIARIKYHQPLWLVLGSGVRSWFPPPSSLQQLEDVLHEEWYSIPLETIQNFHESFPRRIQTVLQVNGGPTQ